MLNDRASTLFLGLVALYLAAITVPTPLFRHRLEHGTIRLHATEPIDRTAARAVLAETERLLHASRLAPSSRVHRVFLTASPGQFAVFANRGYRSFAVHYPGVRTLFLAPSDLRTDRIRANRAAHGSRRLSGVLAHEITHTLIEEELGIPGALLLPAWKREGVSDYVARESSFDLARGTRLLREGRTDPSRAFDYLRARLRVQYLVEERGMSLPEVLRAEIDEAALDAELRSHLVRRDGGADAAPPPARRSP